MTQGCRWREKSFNVAVNSDKPLDICKCGAEIYKAKYLYNGETLCQKCFSEQKSIKQRLGISELGFNTTRDKLFEFIDNNNFRQPIEIKSKGHWKRLLKQHGLTDDVDYKKPNELRQVYEEKKLDRRFIAHEINRELQERGLRNKLFKRR